ncbi:hypothetical protein [Sediminicola luteus]|uniref:Uncharacterized protein n=1 Tax=Sediminicola luteus TaxID=319238 RepID=A0ABV2U0E5_9FLAO
MSPRAQARGLDNGTATFLLPPTLSPIVPSPLRETVRKIELLSASL